MADRQIWHQDLERFVAQVLRTDGMDNGTAQTVADTMVWANLRGNDGQGVSRLAWYLKLIASGDLDPKAQPQIQFDLNAIFLLNGQRCAGPVAMTRAVDEGVLRAADRGACIGVVTETTHTGALGAYVRRAAQQGYAAIAAGAGAPVMAYHGAKVPSLSTSPIAIAVPAGRYGAVALDMATSAASWGRIEQFRQSGQKIPDGWILTDDDGAPTQPAPIPLPLGGPKGSGLALMIELITGGLSGNPILEQAIGPRKDKRRRQNALLIVLKADAFQDSGGFAADAQALLDVIKTLPLQYGFDELHLPGERGDLVELSRRSDGIPIGSQLWQTLADIATARGLVMPDPVA